MVAVMTLILVSTVRRCISAAEPSGYIYVADLDSQQILRRCIIVEPAYRGMDPNPRGGMRGSKGISIRNDQIALANSTHVFRYDPQWNLLGIITHPLCAGIHDILFHEDFLFVTSARTDLLFQFDLAGNLLKYFNVRESSSISKLLDWHPPITISTDHMLSNKVDFRDPRTHKEEETDNAHVNSVAILSDRSILISLGFIIGTDYAKLLQVKKSFIKMGVWAILLKVNQQFREWMKLKDDRRDNAIVIRPAKARSAIVRIFPDGRHSLCLTLPGTISPCHSLLALEDDTAIYLNTTDGTILHFIPDHGEVLSVTKVTEGFLRGVTMSSNGTFLLGSNGDLIIFDLTTREKVGTMQLTNDPDESVFDIKILPAHYAIPPVSFHEHILGASDHKDFNKLVELI